jgi:hypothetical protein
VQPLSEYKVVHAMHAYICMHVHHGPCIPMLVVNPDVDSLLVLTSICTFYCKLLISQQPLQINECEMFRTADDEKNSLMQPEAAVVNHPHFKPLERSEKTIRSIP